jgi:hypothetical protein
LIVGIFTLIGLAVVVAVVIGVIVAVVLVSSNRGRDERDH